MLVVPTCAPATPFQLFVCDPLLNSEPYTKILTIAPKPAD